MIELLEHEAEADKMIGEWVAWHMTDIVESPEKEITLIYQRVDIERPEDYLTKTAYKLVGVKLV